MKISNISTVLYEYPLRHPIGDVNLPEGVETGLDLAVFIETEDSDLTGVTVGLPSARKAIDAYSDRLIGTDPRSVRGIWDRLVAETFKTGVAGSAKAAISAIDCALWDLKAKASEVPLWKELGGSTNRVPIYASGLDYPLSTEELREYYEEMAHRGIHVGKVKVGRTPERDCQRVRAALEALRSEGSTPEVMVDANEYWSPKQAIQWIRAIEEDIPLTWVEEPVKRADVSGLRRVSQGIAAPVATGENLNVPEDYVPLLHKDAVDVVQIGVLTSGVTGAIQTAAVARAHNRPVTMSNCPGQHMAHVAAALSNHTLMEYLGVGRNVVLETAPSIENGELILGTQPGSGIAFDEERLAAHEVDEPSDSTLGAQYRRATDAGGVGLSDTNPHNQVNP